jgi:hypothetical protein
MTTDSGSGNGTDCRTDSGTGYGGLSGSILCGFSTNLDVSVLATVAIILAEGLDGITTSRQNHDGRACRQHRARTQKDSANNDRDASRSKFSLGHFHFSGCGRTFCQPSGHSLT